MRDLVPTLPALVLPTIGTMAGPGRLADVPGLVSDIERRFLALEAYCAEVGDILSGDAEFYRLDRLVTEATQALAEAPAPDLGGLVAKARALIHCPAIEEDDERSERVGASLARDVLRLLGAASTPTGDHHA